MPCNARGWAFTAFLVALLLGGVGLVDCFTNEGAVQDLLSLAVVAAVFSYGWWVSERHS